MKAIPVATLLNKFDNTNFLFTITQETYNEFGNTLLILEVWNSSITKTQIIINKPTNKVWKALAPELGKTYEAVMAKTSEGTVYLKPHKILLPPKVNQDTITEYSTTLTNYCDLPYTPGTPIEVSCKILNSTVDNPSMLLCNTQGIFRVKIPANMRLPDTLAQIDGNRIEVVLVHKSKKSKLRLSKILGSMSKEDQDTMSNFKLKAITHKTCVTTTTSEQSVISDDITFVVGDTWVSISSPEITAVITEVEPISNGYLVWINCDNTHTTYYTSEDFISVFRLPSPPTNWPNGKPSRAVLVQEIATETVTTIDPALVSNAELYRPLTQDELATLSYLSYDDDELPF